MNKFWKTLITCILLVVACLCFTACENGGSENGANGYVFKTYGDDGYYTLVSYKGEDKTLNVPAEYEGKKVGRIKANAFSGNKTIENLVIPTTVEVIDQSAFGGMSALKELTVPFVGQYALAEAKLGDNNVSGELKAVDMARTFGFMFSTTSYDGGMSLTQTYNDATETDSEGNTTATGVFTFYMPALLKTVNIVPAEDNYVVPAYAFYGNVALHKITLSDKVMVIGEKAFANCLTLNTLTIPNSVKTIESHAIYGCRALSNEVNGVGFKFADESTLTTIGDFAFAGSKLVSIEIPASVTKIGKYAFSSITSGNEVTESGATQLKQVAIKGATVEIDEGAFYMCEKLERVEFSNASASVKLGAYAFAYCKNLNVFDSASPNVINLAKVSEISTMAFANIKDLSFNVMVGSFTSSALESLNVFFKTEVTFN